MEKEQQLAYNARNTPTNNSHNISANTQEIVRMDSREPLGVRKEAGMNPTRKQPKADNCWLNKLIWTYNLSKNLRRCSKMNTTIEGLKKKSSLLFSLIIIIHY